MPIPRRRLHLCCLGPLVSKRLTDTCCWVACGCAWRVARFANDIRIWRSSRNPCENQVPVADVPRPLTHQLRSVHPFRGFAGVDAMSRRTWKTDRQKEGTRGSARCFASKHARGAAASSAPRRRSRQSVGRGVRRGDARWLDCEVTQLD